MKIKANGSGRSVLTPEAVIHGLLRDSKPGAIVRTHYLRERQSPF